MSKPAKIVVATLVALASAAIGWFGVKWFQTSQIAGPVGPSASGQPPATDTVRLTWDLPAVQSAAEPLLAPPACGDVWEPTPTDANSVAAVVETRVTEPGGVDTIIATLGVRSSAADPLAFLASEGNVVVTRDGVVVSPDLSGEFVPNYFLGQPRVTTPTGATMQITGPQLCDVADELNQIWTGVDFATATPEEIAAAQAQTAEFNARHAQLPAGTYRVYVWTPVFVDEDAAIARALADEGVTDLATMPYTIGNGPLGADPRIQDYCADDLDVDGAVIGRICDVPQDVLQEVVARDVPTSYIVAGEPAVAISVPAVIDLG